MTHTIGSIEWEVDKSEMIDRDPEERMISYVAYGVDVTGGRYVGTAVYCCGELLGIEDVELI